MATVLHEHTRENGNNTGTLVAVILLVLLAIAFFVYGLPYINGANQGPSVSVPEKVDVNVNTPNTGQ